MSERSRRIEVWSYFERVLKSATVAEKGHIACLDLGDGKLVPVSTATDLFPIGYFETSLTGDGTLKARVELFKELRLHRFDNDTSTAVTDAEVGGFCYLKDTKTVSGDSTGRSKAGRVWAANASFVLVEMAMETGPEGPQGEQGEPGEDA